LFSFLFDDTNDCCIDFSSPFPCLTAAGGCKLGTRRATWQHASGCGSAGPTFVSPSFSIPFCFFLFYLFIFLFGSGKKRVLGLGPGLRSVIYTSTFYYA
jgi:hypothetical protein